MDIARLKTLGGIQEQTDARSEIGNYLIQAFDGDPQFLEYDKKAIRLDTGSDQHELQINANALVQLHQFAEVSAVTLKGNYVTVYLG